jgi:hypothetical protein
MNTPQGIRANSSVARFFLEQQHTKTGKKYTKMTTKYNELP